MLQLGDGLTINGSVTGNIADNAPLVFANPPARPTAARSAARAWWWPMARECSRSAARSTYSGGTTVGGGSLVMGSLSAIGSGNVTVAGGKLNLGGNSPTLGSNAFTLASGTLTGSGSTLTAATYGLRAGEVDADLGGGTLTKTTAGLATVTGTLGAATVNVAAGNLSLAVGNQLTGSPALSLSGQLTLAGNETLGSLSLAGGTLAGSGLTATVGGSAPLAIQAGSITANLSAGGLGLSKTTGGTAILSGTDSYGGGTTASGGVLQLGNSLALGSTAGGLTVNSGTLDLNGKSPTVGALQSTGNTGVVASSGGSATLTAGAGDATSTFNGVIVDGVGPVSLVKIGNGMLTLTGSNTYSGGTSISSGTLGLVAGSSLGSSAGAVTLGAATLQTTGAVVLDNAINLTDPNSTINTPSYYTDALTLTGLVSGSGALNKTGLGILALADTAGNTYTGETNVSAGTLMASVNNALSPNSNLLIADGASVILAFGGGGQFDLDQVGGFSPVPAPSLAAPALSPPSVSPAGISTVPEPGTLTLLLAGTLAGLMVWRRRSR